VGFAWCSEHGVSLGDGARAVVAGWGLVGPLRLVLRGWPRQLVELPLPAGRRSWSSRRTQRDAARASVRCCSSM
jgi:hypothetical protein